MQKTDTGSPVLIQFPTAQVLASQRLPALEIVAYTGGFMTIPGWIAADVRVIEGVTGFSRWGIWPGTAVSAVILIVGVIKKLKRND